MLEAGAKLHRGFLAGLLPPRFPSLTSLGGFILRGSHGLIGGGLGRFPLQTGGSWNPVCVWEGEGREGGGKASTLGGTAPALPAEEVTPCVVALGAPGPPAKCLETAHLGQEGLEGQGWAPCCEGFPRCSPPASWVSRVRDTLRGAATGDMVIRVLPQAPVQLPRCLPGAWALLRSAANGLALVLEGAGGHCSRNNAPWKSAQPGKVGGWGLQRKPFPPDLQPF